MAQFLISARDIGTQAEYCVHDAKVYVWSAKRAGGRLSTLLLEDLQAKYRLELLCELPYVRLKRIC